ncbi:MAG: rod shape-determining protein [Armatimonadetes bacterium]|nr:rod shape-determining protein [Armatimonadota bacterium]
MIIDGILKNFSLDVGIDLGTSNTPVIVCDRGIRFREPSYVAVDQDNKIIAVGSEAKLMSGRVPKNIRVIRPLKDGIINNFEIAKELIGFLIYRLRNQKLFKPRVMIGIHSDATPVEKRAVIEACRLGGARSVYLIEQSLAAALGSNLPVLEAHGSMIVDIGGGTIEAAVISLGGIVIQNTGKMAGDEMDEAIINFVKKKYNLLVGNRSAEEIKIYLGQVYPAEEVKKMIIKGRDLNSGLPKMLEISNNEICEVFEDILKEILRVIKFTLEATPPELITDIVNSGIVLTGGGGLLKDLDRYIAKETGVKCILSRDPLLNVVWGMDLIFKSKKLTKIFLNNEF